MCAGQEEKAKTGLMKMGKIKKHKWTKRKNADGSVTYKSNYSVEELNKYRIAPAKRKKSIFDFG